MTATLIVTRGLPGSGKTTWAKFVCATGPDATIRVNRDDTRRSMFGSDDQDYYDCGKNELFRKETLVTEANHHTISAALKAGFVVICDDTNLPLKRVRDLRKLAVAAGAEFQVQDFSDVPLATCLRYNLLREDKESVPEQVITDMFNRFIKGGLAPLVDEEELDSTTMVPEGLPNGRKSAYIFDIDGTLAHIPEGGRSPYDYSRVLEDGADDAVIDIAQALSKDHVIIVLSGRKDECRQETEEWLKLVGVPYDFLFMRESGDDRQDWKVKYELFDKFVRPEYTVGGVFDDRIQVLRMWEEIGLKTFRVGGLEGGNF